MLAAAALFRTLLLAALDEETQAQELRGFVDREAGGAQVVQRRLLQVGGAVADIEDGDAAGGGGLGEFQRAGHRGGLFLAHPAVPGDLVVVAAVADQAGLVGRVVEHGLVDVDDHGRCQAGGGVGALFRDQGVPVRGLERAVELDQGGAEGLAGQQAVFHRGLQPGDGVEVVVGGRTGGRHLALGRLAHRRGFDRFQVLVGHRAAVGHRLAGGQGQHQGGKGEGLEQGHRVRSVFLSGPV